MEDKTNSYLDKDKADAKIGGKNGRTTYTVRLSERTTKEFDEINSSYSDAIAYLVGFYLEKSKSQSENNPKDEDMEKSICEKINSLNEKIKTSNVLLKDEEDREKYVAELKRRKEQLVRQLAQVA